MGCDFLNKKLLIFAIGILLWFGSCASVFPDDADIESLSNIEKGKPNFILDFLGNILGLPKKIILLNPKIDSHRISPKTEQFIHQFIKDNPEEMQGVKIRLNQWTPVGEFKRLVKNRKVSWYWRLFPGIPVTLFSSLTGRILGGDHYNPYTDTINIFSDDPAIVLHEANHAKDFAIKAKEGTADLYAVGRVLPPVTLYQEYLASEETTYYLAQQHKREEELKSYRTLYPAYGTYLGGCGGIPYGEIVGAVIGHGAGILKCHERKIYYTALDEARQIGEVTTLESDPVAISLLSYEKQIHDAFMRTFE